MIIKVTAYVDVDLFSEAFVALQQPANVSALTTVQDEVKSNLESVDYVNRVILVSTEQSNARK